MKRTQNQAMDDLRRHLASWLESGARPGIHVFVYPPEWEAAMLARFPLFAAESALAGFPVDVVDVGQGFLAEIENDPLLRDDLFQLERESRDRLLHDLGIIAEGYLTTLLQTPVAPPGGARLLVNLGALGAFASYSALANALHDDGPGSRVGAPTILAFPGEGDERSLSLLRLRADSNYRIPRI